jgi:ornithine lipid ester-linked acyl 2-hydroxylase
MQDFRSLEANFSTIKKEYEQIKNSMLNYPETNLYNNAGWEVFPIFNWPHGEIIEETSKLLPETTKLIEKYVPNHKSASFSRLKPKTIIKPHMGHQGDFLRYHLGIDVYEGNCGLRSEGKVYRWENGKSFVFDDRKVHSAWNKSSKDRVILIIDFTE